MRRSVPTPYGTLPISVRLHPEAYAVIVTVAGPIHMPDRAPTVLGESISLDYRYDALRGWYEVDWTGKPWIELPSMTVASTTREIQAAVVLWLSDNHEMVKSLVVAGSNWRLRERTLSPSEPSRAASANASAANALVDEVRDRHDG